MHYVYILQSIGCGKLYVGRTANLKQRLRDHCQGRNYSTKQWRPLKLVFYEAFCDQADSIRRERYLKTSKGRSTIKQMLRYSL